ncbi:hypothetical protein Bca52824_011097 [Brassica carinata]|uniref:Uncharacterized protein n=1 Tax=Brassica carinata TaxID=52824 RepID=A0A8X7WEQ5_BRACI|nr:hypothetical protein Bca52824_011097 [Brassica carinata]
MASEVQPLDRTNQTHRTVYRFDPRTSEMELQQDPRPNDRIDRAETRFSRPTHNLAHREQPLLSCLNVAFCIRVSRVSVSRVSSVSPSIALSTSSSVNHSSIILRSEQTNWLFFLLRSSLPAPGGQERPAWWIAYGSRHAPSRFSVCVEAGMLALLRDATEVNHEDFNEGIIQVEAKRKTSQACKLHQLIKDRINNMETSNGSPQHLNKPQVLRNLFTWHHKEKGKVEADMDIEKSTKEDFETKLNITSTTLNVTQEVVFFEVDLEKERFTVQITSASVRKGGDIGMASAKLSMSKAGSNLQKQLEAYKQHSEISRCSPNESIEHLRQKFRPTKQG